MTIQATIAALQAVHAEVAGVVSAPTVYPSSLDTAMLPCILTIPGEGTIDLETINAKKRADTTYRVFVYVAPVAQGAGVDEGVQDAIDLMQALRDAYLTETAIALIRGVAQSTLKTSRENPIRHTGIGVITFGETAYRGFTYDVGVMEKW